MSSEQPPARPGLLARLNPVTRLREFRRTCWQLKSLWRCGTGGLRLAEEVIATRQCLQRKWELMGLMALVRRLRPAVVVEIGTYRGGTLRCWAAMCPESTAFVSVDLPGGSFGGGCSDEEAARFKDFLKPGQTLTTIRADSHAPETLAEVRRALAGRPVDFLFIDGDHSYAGVKADYEMYSGLVRPGGLIGFHDIVPHPHSPDCRVHEFWAEMKKLPSARELVDRDGYDTWGGIGVVTRQELR
jgi:cephalosporin hydroxylase